MTSADGNVPEAVELAATAAEKAATAATTASADLSTKLDTFKNTAAGSDMSGADVEATAMSELEKLTEAAKEAATEAGDAAKRAVRAANEAKKASAKSSQQTGKAAGAIVAAAAQTVKEASKVKQETQWAINDADDMKKKSEKALADIGTQKKDAGDQLPVLEARETGIQESEKGMTDAHGRATTAISDMEPLIQALKDAAAPLKEAAEKAAGGNAVDSLNQELIDAEAALDKAKNAVANTLAKQRTLKEREASLKKMIEGKGKL